MAKYRKKYHKAHSALRSNRTGEDIDMLRERGEESSYKSSSSKYKDHIDGA